MNLQQNSGATRETPSVRLHMSVYDLCPTRRDPILSLSLAQVAALPQLMTNMGLR
jgi:hypothetical protein